MQERFAFLSGHGFGEARIHVLPPRECTIVYWGASGTNVAIFHDLGGPPCVFVVPLPMRRADSSTRSFGVQEAVAVLAPAYQAQRPGSWEKGWDRLLDLAWLDWYADFLRERAPALLKPSRSPHRGAARALFAVAAVYQVKQSLAAMIVAAKTPARPCPGQ